MSVSLNAGGGGKEVLTAARTYFVATSGFGGNDSNDGLTAGTSFLTIQKAVDTWAELDNDGFTVTISISPGTFDSTGVNIPDAVGGGTLAFSGSGTITEDTSGTFGNYSFTATGSQPRVITFDGIQFEGGGQEVGPLLCSDYKDVTFSNCTYGNFDFFSRWVEASDYCRITWSGVNNISGANGLDSFIQMNRFCYAQIGGTLNLNVSPFGSDFVGAFDHCVIQTGSFLLTVGGVGSFTGNQFNIGRYSIVDDFGTINLPGFGLRAFDNSMIKDQVGLGEGTNTDADTLKFANNVIANEDGIQADIRTTTGAPTNTPPDGSLIVNTTDDDLYFRSGGAWIQANGGGGGGGTAYADVNSAGTLPVVSGPESIAIGAESEATQSQAIAIGFNTTATGVEAISIGSLADNSGEEAIVIGNDAACSVVHGIAIGRLASVQGADGVAIGEGSSTGVGSRCTAVGPDCTTTGATDAVAIGDTAQASGNQSVAIGNQPTASGNDSVAIGDVPSAAGLGAVAIGEQANASGSFYPTALGTQTVASNDRTVALGFGADATDLECIAIGSNAQAIDSRAIAIGSNANADGTLCVAIGREADAGDNENVAIGYLANTDISTQSVAIGVRSDARSACVAIGENAQATGSSSVAIGGNQPEALDSDCIAIGDNAVANAASAVQIGNGSNTTASTLQFLSLPIANATSVQVATQATGSAPASTPVDGTIIVDTNGTGTLYVRAGGAWRSVALT